MTFANLFARSARKVFSWPLFVSESGRQDVDFSDFDGRGEVEIRVGLSLRALSALEVVSLTSTPPIWKGFRDRLKSF